MQETTAKVRPQLTKRVNWPLLLTVQETADLLRVDPDTVRRLARQRELPAVKVGKEWRFSRDEVFFQAREWWRKGKGRL